MRKLNRLHFLPGLLLLLALGWPAIPAAQASDTGAPSNTGTASTTGTATITVVAPGAAIGQAVKVEWGDPLGGWHRVDGWTGTLDHLTRGGLRPLDGFIGKLRPKPLPLCAVHVSRRQLDWREPQFQHAGAGATQFVYEHGGGLTLPTQLSRPRLSAPKTG
jgi:hypothetical protein